MNPDEWQSSEQGLFNELRRASMSDDLLCEAHRSALRQQAMDTFERSQRAATLPLRERVQVPVPTARTNRNASQMFAVVASVAVCLLSFVSLFFAPGNESTRDVAGDVLMGSRETVDPEFIAALAKVQALRGRVPSEMYYTALSICQEEFKARLSHAVADQIRFLHEVLHQSLPPVSSKG